MATALRATFGDTAEGLVWVALAVGLVWAGALLGWGRRHAAPGLVAWLPVPLVVLALGTLAARGRDGAVPHGVDEFPDRFVAAYVAVSHHSAMRVAWWASVVAALLLAMPAAGLTRGRRLPGAAGALGTAAMLLVAAGLGAGEAGWSALPCVLAASALAGEARGPSHALASLALVVAAIGAPIGGDAAVYRLAQLTSRADLAALDAAVVGRLVAIGATGLGLAAALAVLVRLRSGVADVAALGLAALSAGSISLRDRALAEGPPDALAELELPVTWVDPPFRLTSGCLVRPDDDGWDGVPLGEGRCPEVVRPGAFGPAEVPFVVLPEDGPAAGLAGWSGSSGRAAALVRLDDGGGLAAWRVAQVGFTTWSDAHPPIRGAVVVPPGTPADVVAAQVGSRPKVDVAFAGEAPVGEVLRTCAAVQRPGVTCGVVVPPAG